MRGLLAAVILVATTVAVPALAHHGWSSYDAGKTIEVTAELQGVNWGNPHGSAKVAYQGKTWDVVLAPVARWFDENVPPELRGDPLELTR